MAKKMKTAEEWLELFEKDNFIDTKNWKETIPALILVGALQFGITKKAKKKIMNWIGLKYEYGKIGRCRYFERCWERLEKNGVFKNGKIIADFEEEPSIELALLINVAQGYLKRENAKKNKSKKNREE